MKTVLVHINLLKIISNYIQISVVSILFCFIYSCSNKNENKTKTHDNYESNQSFNSANIDKTLVTEITQDDTWSVLMDGKSIIKSVNATNDGGAVILIQNNIDKTIKIIKYNDEGQIDFEKLLTNNIYSKCFLSVNNNNECLIIIDDKIMIIDGSGEILKEDVLNSNGVLGNICRVYFYDSEILIISDYTLLNLNTNFNLIKEIYFSDIYSRLSQSNNNRRLAINSITKDFKGNYYFTGKDNDLLWYGKLSPNFELVWEKSNLELEQNKEKPEAGVTILYTNEDKIFLLSKFSNYSDRGKSVLLCIDSSGFVKWRRNLVGICRDDTFNDYLIKTNNFIYAFTMDKQFFNRSDYRTYNSNNWEYGMIHKYDFSGNNIFTNEINVDSRRISYSAASVNGNPFFVTGKVQELSASNNRHISYTALIKFNAEGKTQKKIITN